jgi:hypothetical protein
MSHALTSKRWRRKPRPPKKLPYMPVDPAGNPIDILLSPAPKRSRERPPTPDEVKRRHAPLNSHHDGFRLMR